MDIARLRVVDLEEFITPMAVCFLDEFLAKFKYVI
jgi:hypothetical protein